MFSTSDKNILIIIVRSFDVANFVDTRCSHDVPRTDDESIDSKIARHLHHLELTEENEEEESLDSAVEDAPGEASAAASSATTSAVATQYESMSGLF